MSNKTEITQNTVELQEILATVKSLPEAGNGSGNAKEEQEKSLEVTENGNYDILPDSGKVLSKASVKVSVPERYDEGYSKGYQASQDSITLQEKTVTENGEVVADEGYTGLLRVSVNVPSKEEQAKSIDITENGTIEVVPEEGKTLSKVTVTTNVLGGSGEVGKPYIDTSQMINFDDFFEGSFGNSIDLLPYIDTSNGLYFSYMFSYNAELFEFPALDTSKGVDFEGMFFNCENLVTVPLLNISNAERVIELFRGCSNLESVNLVSQVNEDHYIVPEAYEMFTGCTSLTNLQINEGWSIPLDLKDCERLTQECLHSIIENIGLAGTDRFIDYSFTISSTSRAKIDDAHIAMLSDKGWELIVV